MMSNNRLPLAMKHKTLHNITPGEILEKEFLEAKGITEYRLAKDISVPARRINEIVKGKRLARVILEIETRNCGA